MILNTNIENLQTLLDEFRSINSAYRLIDFLND